MGDNPYESPEEAGESQTPSTGAFRRSLVEILVAVGIVGLLVALLLPAVRSAPEAARRMQCSNNLQQIAFALLNYESDYGALPPAYTVNAAGKPLHSWRTLILPYLEEQPLYDRIDRSKPWNDPANEEANETNLSVFQCPSANVPRGHTTYLAVVVPGGCFHPTRPRELSEITDGTQSTLMVVEVASKDNVHWMSPKDAGKQWLRDLEGNPAEPHSGGFQTVFVDGHVQFLVSRMNHETLRALISIDGDDDEVIQGAN